MMTAAEIVSIDGANTVTSLKLSEIFNDVTVLAPSMELDYGMLRYNS